MRCNEVIRQLAVPTDDCDPAMLCRASGDMSVVRGLGQACRATRSALGRPRSRQNPLPGLGGALWAHCGCLALSVSPTHKTSYVPCFVQLHRDRSTTRPHLKPLSYSRSPRSRGAHLGGDRTELVSLEAARAYFSPSG